MRNGRKQFNHAVFVALVLVPLTGWTARVRATDEAAESFSRHAKEAVKPTTARQRALAEFDTDGDGKLSLAERRAARTAIARKRRLAQEEEDTLNAGSTWLSGTGNGSPPGTSPSTSGSTPYGYNPYTSGGAGSGSYYYYNLSGFGSTGQTGATGTGGGCMNMGSMAGRR